MNRLTILGLFVVVLLLGSSCSRGFDPTEQSTDYDNLKQSIQRLIDLRSESVSSIATYLDFDIKANTTVWTFPDGSLAGKSYSREFIETTR